MEALRVGRDRWDVGRHVHLEDQLARFCAWPDDCMLLLELATEVDRGDVERDGPRLNARKVEELLGHPQHPL